MVVATIKAIDIVVVGTTLAIALWITVVTAFDGRRRVSPAVAKRHKRGLVMIWLLFILNTLRVFTGAYH
jgi:hypothetical protein